MTLNFILRTLQIILFYTSIVRTESIVTGNSNSYVTKIEKFVVQNGGLL